VCPLTTTAELSSCVGLALEVVCGALVTAGSVVVAVVVASCTMRAVEPFTLEATMIAADDPEPCVMELPTASVSEPMT
jgi:hypothetical protein